MCPEEKAEYLIDKYRTFGMRLFDCLPMPHEAARQCAMIAVDEILKCGGFEIQSIYEKERGMKPKEHHICFWIKVKIILMK